MKQTVSRHGTNSFTVWNKLFHAAEQIVHPLKEIFLNKKYGIKRQIMPETGISVRRIDLKFRCRLS